MVEIAVMGFGTVGSGVVEVLANHTDSISKRAKEQIDIKYILDLRDFPDSPFADRFTTVSYTHLDVYKRQFLS